MSTAWSRIDADLALAASQAREAEERLALLANGSAADREARLVAMGKFLHDASGLCGRALGALLAQVEGVGAPPQAGARVIRRAMSPGNGRGPILSRASAAGLILLLRQQQAFRRIGCPPEPMIASAAREAATAIPRLREEITAFAAGLGLAPRA